MVSYTLVNIGLGNGLVPLGNKPLPKPMLLVPSGTKPLPEWTSYCQTSDIRRTLVGTKLAEHSDVPSCL